MNIKDTKKTIKENNPIFASRPNLCYLPWIHLEASAIGEIKPCCMADGPVVDVKTGIPLTLTSDTLLDAYHSAFMGKLRMSMLSGQRPEICKKCWDEEDAGVVSKRLIFADQYSKKPEFNGIFTTPVRDSGLVFLDLKLGNICNLKCRICGPMSSSKWVKDEIDVDVKFHGFDKHDKKSHPAYKFSKQGQWPRDNKLFWNDLEKLLPQITHLEFTGGEPWMIQEHFDLLEKAVELGYAKNIYVHYNTNGTQFNEKAMYDVWPHFKEINIAFSIDDIDEYFEYQRKGAEWRDVLQNIILLCHNKSPNITTEICTTVNVLNIHHLPQLAERIVTLVGLDSWYLNLLHSPNYFNISNTSNAHKQFITFELMRHDWDQYDHLYGNKEKGTVREEIRNLISFMNENVLEDATQVRSDLQNEISNMDDIRGESLEKIDPKLYKLIEEAYDET